MTLLYGIPNLEPLPPVMTFVPCPDETPGVTRKDMGKPLRLSPSISDNLSNSLSESMFILHPVSTTSFNSLSDTFTPVYIILSGENPALRQVSTSPMETASMQLPSCSNILRIARFVLALHA